MRNSTSAGTAIPPIGGIVAKVLGEICHRDSIATTTVLSWRCRGGGPALDVYGVEDYDDSIDATEEVNGMLSYEKSFWPQGLWRVTDDRPTDRVVSRFDI